MKHLTLPQNYMIARYIYLSDELSKLPVITRGVHDGIIVYKYSHKGKKHSFRYNSENGEKLEKIYINRTRISSNIEKLKASFTGDIIPEAAGQAIKINPCTFLNEDFYTNSNANASPYRNEYKYELNGVKYRSRGELMIAQVLTDMGLEFKYECPIKCGSTIYTADFLIYLPEFKRCFIIEYLGRLDDEEYVFKNSRKMKEYLNKGIYFGRDIAILCGNTFETPTAKQIHETICYMLGYITSDHLVDKSFL